MPPWRKNRRYLIAKFGRKKRVHCIGPVSDRLLDHRPSIIDDRLVQARTKFNRLLAMVDDLNGDQKQAHYRPKVLRFSLHTI